MQLFQETPQDWWEVEALYDLCFSPGRTALSSYRLREGVDPVSDLCLLARDETGALAGAIRFWPVRVGGAPVLLLGPVAVHPTRQGEGIGALLIEGALESGLRYARRISGADASLGDGPALPHNASMDWDWL